jgi:hypothetical protein
MWGEAGSFAAVKRTLLAAALLVTSVFGVTGCGSDDVPPAESRIKNGSSPMQANEDIFDRGLDMLEGSESEPRGSIKHVPGDDFGNIRGQVDVSKSGARGMSNSMARDSNLRRDRGSMSFLDDDMDD